MTEELRKRGAAFGNQNARTHGYYSQVLDDLEQQRYEQAVQVEGLDHEIALLRVKLLSVVEKDPENIKLITKAAEALAKLLCAKYNIGKNDKKGKAETIDKVLKDYVIPFGINLGKAILKKDDL